MNDLRSRLRPWLSRGGWVMAALAMVHPLAFFVARWDWRADLLTHFQAPALGLTLLSALICVRFHRAIAVGLAVLAIYQLPPLVRYHFSNPVRPVSGKAPILRILMANLLVDNDQYAEVAATIAREQPDIVGLVEYSAEWHTGLSRLVRDYPYRFEVPDGAFGLALWFREAPVAIDRINWPSADGWPYFHARIRFAGEVRELWLVHPSSPLRRLGRHWGFPELDGLARDVAKQGGSAIVVGDFNTTDGSPHFHDFLRTTNLRDSRVGFGTQPSWPAWSPYQIAIDHAFVPPDLAVVTRRLLEPNGSDHRPLLIELAPAEAIVASNASPLPAASSP